MTVQPPAHVPEVVDPGTAGSGIADHLFPLERV